jgi:hypothetical protein
MDYIEDDALPTTQSAVAMKTVHTQYSLKYRELYLQNKSLSVQSSKILYKMFRKASNNLSVCLSVCLCLDFAFSSWNSQLVHPVVLIASVCSWCGYGLLTLPMANIQMDTEKEIRLVQGPLSWKDKGASDSKLYPEGIGVLKPLVGREERSQEGWLHPRYIFAIYAVHLCFPSCPEYCSRS